LNRDPAERDQEGGTARRGWFPLGTRRPLVRFLAVFFVLWLLSFVIVQKAEELNRFLRIETARQVDATLDFLGESSQRDGEKLVFRGGRNSLVIIDECTGLFTFFVYLSLILAYPATWKEKGWGFVLGLPSIWLMNHLRLLVIAYLTVHRPSLFDFFHGFLWQVSFFLFMLLIVYVWLTRIVRPPGRKASPGAIEPTEEAP
jgi:archaeosortase B (VPXXXP-CTERM-specific)